jgi:hypothetical protein
MKSAVVKSPNLGTLFAIYLIFRDADIVNISSIKKVDFLNH